MKDTTRVKVIPLNPGGAKELKAQVYDLTELAAKQALYGIVQALSFRANITSIMFKEIIDDAVKYSKNKKEG